jgi:hypothetical protein
LSGKKKKKEATLPAKDEMSKVVLVLPTMGVKGKCALGPFLSILVI